MGERPLKMSIERIDNSGNYNKENCKWASDKEQSWNRRSNRAIKAFGEYLPVAEWSRRLGGQAGLVSYRIDKLGWDPVRAITTPKDLVRVNY